MAWLVAMGAAVGLLYFWLIGHWFARVLLFRGLRYIHSDRLGRCWSAHLGSQAPRGRQE